MRDVPEGPLPRFEGKTVQVPRPDPAEKFGMIRFSINLNLAAAVGSGKSREAIRGEIMAMTDRSLAELLREGLLSPDEAEVRRHASELILDEELDRAWLGEEDSPS